MSRRTAVFYYKFETAALARLCDAGFSVESLTKKLSPKVLNKFTGNSLIAMQIFVNGHAFDIGEGITIRDALKALGHNPEIYIVARNGEITHENESLSEGDKLDLVKITSGG